MPKRYMHQLDKAKGFTMMELLVTVLLIAILAGTAMPLYMKVVEKQKGTEAVNLLASIGKAQERYFAVNETYTTDFADLDVDLVDCDTKSAANGNSLKTKYFVFFLDGTNDNISKVQATRRGNESYILERNYTTGSVCCKNDNTADGDICEVLDLEDNSCEADTDTTPVTPPTDPVDPDEPESHDCTGTQPAQSQDCNNCGTQTRAVTCDTSSGTWVSGQWSACTGSKVIGDACGIGYTGNKTRTCTNNVWGNWDSSGCVALVCPVGTTVMQTCANDYNKTSSRTMQSSGAWSPWTGC